MQKIDDGKVRAECPWCAKGTHGHMTMEELTEQGVRGNGDLSCPACGLHHGNREKIDMLEKRKIFIQNDISKLHSKPKQIPCHGLRVSPEHRRSRS